MSDNHNHDDLFPDDLYQPIVPKDKYKVQFHIDEPLMRTQPWQKSKRLEGTISCDETMEVMGCALYQMGVCDTKNKLRKMLFEDSKCWIKTCYHSTKADAFYWCNIEPTFRFKIGDIHDNAQIAELVAMRAATESRHCIYKIISNAITEGRSLGPEEL